MSNVPGTVILSELSWYVASMIAVGLKLSAVCKVIHSVESFVIGTIGFWKKIENF